MNFHRTHHDGVFWLYGLSGAGKSTLAMATASALHAAGHPTVILDGDHLRSGMCNDLGFSSKDRLENVRRTAEMAKLLCEQGFIVLVALMTPQENMRQLARTIVGDESFNDVYIKCDFATCMRRDPKGLYVRATAGHLRYFPGFDLIFDEPRTPNLVLDTDKNSIDLCVKLLCQKITVALTIGELIKSTSNYQTTITP
jgi:adenylyl-sulfate kinase